MPNILDEIVSNKLKEIEMIKKKNSLEFLDKMIKKKNIPLNLAGSLMGDSVRVIAEIKQNSPSKGLLTNNFDPLELSKI